MRFLSKFKILVYFITVILFGFSFTTMFFTTLTLPEISPLKVAELSDNGKNSHENLIRTLVKELPFHNSRTDSRSILNIYDWVWIGEKWDEARRSFSVCLSTQGSTDRIHWILEQARNWEGPLSLAVFITSPEEWVGLNLIVHHFKKCSQAFREFVSIHIAIPTESEHWTFNWEQLEHPSIQQFLSDFTNSSCQTSPKIIVNQIREIFKCNQTLMMAYPQNHLRNIAKRSCGSNWVLPMDIDIIPVPNSASLLQKFVSTVAAKSCKKCAFTIPTFELDESVQFPQSKMQLLKYLKIKKATPFHFDVFKKGHNATDYSKWKGTNLKDGPVRVSHNTLRDQMKYYEPFSISLNTIPDFPERFIGYGFTRNSQVQAAVSEGWRYKVLTPIFTIHWGLHPFRKILTADSDSRTKQTNLNSRIFAMFKKELDFRKYLKRKEVERVKSLIKV